MTIPLVDKFFCFNLVTGGRIIGWEGVIESASVFFLTFAQLDELSAMEITQGLINSIIRAVLFGLLIIATYNVK